MQTIAIAAETDHRPASSTSNLLRIIWRTRGGRGELNLSAAREAQSGSAPVDFRTNPDGVVALHPTILGPPGREQCPVAGAFRHNHGDRKRGTRKGGDPA